MDDIQVLNTGKDGQWEAILERCQGYDIYHLPSYHRLVEEQGEGDAALFIFEKNDEVIAMPLLLRQCAEVPGLEGVVYSDATSVYGYPGPVSSLQGASQDVLDGFQNALQEYFRYKKVVFAFSRLNPLLGQDYILDNIGKVVEIGPTVAINLMLPPDVQWQKYRNNHKRDIVGAQEEKVICLYDEEWQYLDAFIEVYHENMRRVGADEYYFFKPTYFERLRTLLDSHIQLFVALKGDVVIAGALVTVCNSVIQYHLGGTKTDYLNLSPIKSIFESVRLWGNDIGATLFHLGGGVGGRKDSLFRFKAGFSNQVYQFKIWRMIADPETYKHLVDQKENWNQAHGLEIADNEYFPAYRAPTREIS